MDWDMASPREAIVVGDKKNKCINSSLVHDLSNNNKPTEASTVQHVSKKIKPIPPPLDLSIGAANLSLHHLNQNLSVTAANHSSSSLSPNQLPPPNLSPWCSSQQSSPHTGLSPFLSSPNFTLQDKKLPPRKRWNSWSPNFNMMSSPDDLSPLLFRDPLNSIKPEIGHDLGLQESGTTTSILQSSFSFATVTSSSSSSMPSASPTGVLGSSGNASRSNNTTSSNYRTTYTHVGSPLSGSLNTPNPFFTPNETSPKFMNSPVFSYSAHDSSLYNGPFTPTRTTMYQSPSSPYSHLSLGTSGGSMSSGCVTGTNSNCFNMIPSTLLSPAPSQASTNSLSYEDLQEKSLNLVAPVWSIFLSGTKVRFQPAAHPVNSMEWFAVDFLAQNESIFNIKGDYAPHGLEVRTLVVTSSSKERIQLTFCPVGNPDHPAVEIDCEPSHPFWVDKKGWCAVKPDVFMEIYGVQCMQLECGDICSYYGRLHGSQLNVHTSSNSNSSQQSNTGGTSQHLVQQSMQLPSLSPSIYSGSSIATAHLLNNNTIGNINLMNVPMGNVDLNGMTRSLAHNGLSALKIESNGLQEVKPVLPPISMLSQNQPNQQVAHSNANQHVAFTVNNNNSSKKATGNNAAASKRSRDKESGTRGNANNNGAVEKGRRPMNAFLLFAKDKRQELIQQYPGKDNRSISVMLGDIWKNMEPQDKEKYNSTSREKAEEQKRSYPDCWKRKRSQSTNVTANKKVYVNGVNAAGKTSFTPTPNSGPSPNSCTETTR